MKLAAMRPRGSNSPSRPTSTRNRQASNFNLHAMPKSGRLVPGRTRPQAHKIKFVMQYNDVKIDRLFDIAIWRHREDLLPTLDYSRGFRRLLPNEVTVAR